MLEVSGINAIQDLVDKTRENLVQLGIESRYAELIICYIKRRSL
jgi:hypothetical protein